MADLVRQYADFPLGTADASVITVAERLGATHVATIDHRHFPGGPPRTLRCLRATAPDLTPE
jgi:predicted nucleic acid-binding protein